MNDSVAMCPQEAEGSGDEGKPPPAEPQGFRVQGSGFRVQGLGLGQAHPLAEEHHGSLDTGEGSGSPETIEGARGQLLPEG